MPVRPPANSVIVLLADGVRPDTLNEAMDAGDLPAIAKLRREGAAFTATTSFPSVTGPAYAPFLTGRFPGPIGLPGLRWIDRSRTACAGPDYARSYVGYQMLRMDSDLEPTAPTIFELTDTSVGAVSMIRRGLPSGRRIGRLSPTTAARVAIAHFTGNLAHASLIDREVSAAVVERARAGRPDFMFAAFGTPDKASHAFGHESKEVRAALRIVDETAARIREDAERDGRWESMHLWIASDHGHSPVMTHDDLARAVGDMGYRTMAHPWTFGFAPQVGVMVSGNAMAHIYLDLDRRERPCWDSLRHRWQGLVDALVARNSVDLALLTRKDGALVRSKDRGEAAVSRTGDRYSYERLTGDPLRIGADVPSASLDEAYSATIQTDYPDSVVQIAALATAPRSGEIILSAARGWDFRARYEPIDHVSSHGSLMREHMLVPLILNRPLESGSRPLRTVDVMPSALVVLGKAVPPGLDGRSFFSQI